MTNYITRLADKELFVDIDRNSKLWSTYYTDFKGQNKKVNSKFVGYWNSQREAQEELDRYAKLFNLQEA